MTNDSRVFFCFFFREWKLTLNNFSFAFNLPRGLNLIQFQLIIHNLLPLHFESLSITLLSQLLSYVFNLHIHWWMQNSLTCAFKIVLNFKENFSSNDACSTTSVWRMKVKRVRTRFQTLFYVWGNSTLFPFPVFFNFLTY